MNVEGFTRPFSIGRVIDAKDRTRVFVQWYAPKDILDPVAAAWSATAERQPVVRAAVRMAFDLQRGGLLPAAVQEDLRSIAAPAAVMDDAAGGYAGAGSGSGSGAGASSGDGCDSSSSQPERESSGAGAGSGSRSASAPAGPLRRFTRSSARSR